MATLVETPPPPIITSDGGGGSDWIPLIKANNDIDAHLLEGRLNEAGIEVRAVHDHSGPSWLMNGFDPWAPVAILVRRYQYDDSRIVLAEVSLAAPAAVKLRAEHEGWTPAVWWTVAIALGLGLSGIGLARSVAYIDRCRVSTTCDATP
ncbi:MAG: putative prokaryotic signal transducing protein [Actinomycetota bacterium]|jgi:hypothetical protein|nr:putative prokaryotic signal transducing protein [Actinomycetota bacterium]